MSQETVPNWGNKVVGKAMLPLRSLDVLVSSGCLFVDLLLILASVEEDDYEAKMRFKVKGYMCHRH